MTHLKAEPPSSRTQNKAHPRRRDLLPAWPVFPGRHAFDRRSVVGPAGRGDLELPVPNILSLPEKNRPHAVAGSGARCELPDGQIEPVNTLGLWT